MCFRASVLLRKASALKRIDVRYGPQNAYFSFLIKIAPFIEFSVFYFTVSYKGSISFVRLPRAFCE